MVDLFAYLWRNAVLLTAAFFAFAIAIGTTHEIVRPLHLGPLGVIAYLVVTTFYTSLIVSFHELGHAVAAWLSGRSVHLIVVGRLAYAPKPRRFFRLKGYSSPDFAGWVFCTPKPGAPWAKGNIPTILGGVLGNLVLAALCMGAGTLLNRSEETISTMLAAIVMLSLIDAAANLIPIWKPGAWQNDGAMLIDAIRGISPDCKTIQKSRLRGMTFDQIPIEEWNVTVLNDLLALPPEARKDVESHLISYALNTADLASIKFILEERLAASGGLSPHGLHTYALVLGLLERDGARALEVLNNYPDHAPKEFAYWRALAVAMHLLRRRDEALEAWRMVRDFERREGLALDDDDKAISAAIEADVEIPPVRPRMTLTLPDRPRPAA